MFDNKTAQECWAGLADETRPGLFDDILGDKKPSNELKEFESKLDQGHGPSGDFDSSKHPPVQIKHYGMPLCKAL